MSKDFDFYQQENSVTAEMMVKDKERQRIADLESNVEAGAYIALAWLNGEAPKGHVLELAARLLALKIK